MSQSSTWASAGAANALSRPAAGSFAVMITTRNRVCDLRRTCEVLQKLSPPPTEILITADGCADGTCLYLKQHLPDAKLFVNPKGLGSVVSRDRMLRNASSELVLSLDDDSYPEQPDCIVRIRRLFDDHPRLAVAHFPQRSDEYPDSLTRMDFGSAVSTGAFANSGACYRREIYASLPGFWGRFFHMYEEPDYALQCIAAGYEVVFSPIVSIRHHYSTATRSELRNHQRHARNEFWSAVLRCPFPYVLAVLFYRIASQAGYARRRGLSWLVREPVWWCLAIRGLPSCLRERKAVRWKSYRQWLSLLRQPSNSRGINLKRPCQPTE